MANKIMHERLREDGWNDIYKMSANEMADEIERYYIPRPRFEDGEPVQFGDAVKHQFGGVDVDNVVNLQFKDYGSVEINGANGHYVIASKGELLERPTPKLLDADGVEIKVGDTVYNLENDVEQGTVKCLYSYGIGVEWNDGWRSDGVYPQYLTHKQPVFDADGVRICEGDTVWHVLNHQKATVTTVYRDDKTCVEVEIKGSLMDYKPSDLTHDEPDSLEKLLEYVIDQKEQEFCSARDVYQEIENRLTAIIERGDENAS